MSLRFAAACLAALALSAGVGLAGECEDTDKKKRLVGVALSGGGSRAAVFGAAGLEALGEHGLLEQVTHLSSVSGGSFAAAYFALHREELIAAAPDETPSEFLNKMRFGYMRPISMRQFKKWRWGSAARRALSLREVLDRQLFNGATLGQLDGSDLTLLVNATRYDDGRRFVMTSPCGARQLAGLPVGEPSEDCPRCGVLQSASLAETEAEEFPLALAVTASASFPPLLGPIAIEVGPGRSWQLGDGGIYDNQGVEALEQIFLQRLRASGGPRRALILVFDSTVGPDAKSEDLSEESRLGWLGQTKRVTEIRNWRADAYHDLAWEAAVEELARTSRARARKVRMVYTDAGLDQCEAIPPSCLTDKKWQRFTGSAETLPEKMPLYLQRIPTKLNIEDCAADLMERAAHKIVHQRLGGEKGNRRVALRDCPVLAGMQCRQAHP